MRNLRVAVGTLTAAFLILGMPAAGHGVKQSLKVRGPHHVKVGGAGPVYTVSGRSHGSKSVAVFTDTQPCARKFRREDHRSSIAAKPVQYSASGAFKHKLRITHSKVGSHYVCVYLYKQQSPFTTYLHAQLRYTAK